MHLKGGDMGGNLEKVSRLNAFEDYLVKLEEFAVFVGMFVVVLSIGYGVLHRYYATGAIVGLEEICVLAGVWMYFFGACLTTYGDTHIKGDLISLFLKSKRKKRVLSIVIKASIAVLLIYVAYKTYLYIDHMATIGVLTTGLKISKIYFLASLFVGFVLMIFHEVVGIVRLVNEGMAEE